MANSVLSYREIAEYFSAETIQDRYRFLYDKMQDYINERGLTDKLVVNEYLLQQAVMDYFADIHRLKEFHKIEHTNKAKIVAYEIHWLLRRKPLQITGQAKEDAAGIDAAEQKLAFANEGFAVTLVGSELLMPREAIPLSPEKEEAFLTFLEHLYYHFKYRNVDKQCLETIFYAFEIGKQCS